ncbi:MAG: DUF11 domain-containing protein [Methanobrevibacter sp.]|jgi:predicted outer membrane repeat protein|nr:DUF11 domain-containing protein [Candidatus Methanoflexus mossambicus]
MKKNRFILVLVFLIVIICSINYCYAANDGTNGNSDTIESGIQDTANGNTLFLKEKVYKSIGNVNITVKKNITIAGLSKEKTIIDGEGKNWIFTLNKGNSLKLVNLTIKNGFRDFAGAIYSQSSLTIENCNFISNKANKNGGVIYNTGNNLNIKNSYFNSNTGAYGGAIYSIGNNTVIDNSVFTGNRAINSAGLGGAIFNNGGNNLKIFNSKFTKNTAIDSGGAIFSKGNNFILNGGTFESNFASSGGAIRTDTGNIFTVSNSVFKSNIGKIRGGAIINEADRFTVVNSNFSTNNAAFGAGIFSYGSMCSVSNSIFASNVANLTATGGTGYGGGIYNYKGNNWTVSNCNFTNNLAKEYGGGIMTFKGRDFTISKSNFISNSAIITGKGNGGGIAVYDTKYVSLSNSIFNKNKANNGGGFYTSGETSKVNNVKFNSNNGKNGGAIYAKGTNFRITNSEFKNNDGSSGGAIISQGKYAKIESSNFDSNTGTNGGAIYITGTGTSSTLNNLDLTKNKGTNGGALYLIGDNLKVTNSNFIANSGKYGGAIRNNGGSKLTITGSNFESNKATGYGGAIHNSGKYVNIKSSSFVRNSASSGGAISNIGSNLKVNYNRFVSNSNTLKNTGTADFNYNWWGKNSAPSGFKISKYFKFSVTRVVGYNNRFTYNMALNSGSGSLSSLPKFNGKIFKIDGSDNNLYKSFSAKSKLTTIFNAKGTYKYLVDNQAISIKADPNKKIAIFKINSTYSKSSIKLSQSSVLTIKIKNDGKTTGKSLILSASISNGLKILRVSKSQGKISGVKWNIGSLSDGKTATLKVTIKSSKKGSLNLIPTLKGNDAMGTVSIKGSKVVLRVK